MDHAAQIFEAAENPVHGTRWWMEVWISIVNSCEFGRSPQLTMTALHCSSLRRPVRHCLFTRRWCQAQATNPGLHGQTYGLTEPAWYRHCQYADRCVMHALADAGAYALGPA